ncbi:MULTISPECIES: phytanoyl-CoA dioxygenase family protein [Amycolatopsis]|uniref:Phytanoyl-CoA dioxygenase family protein n=1 Tax=Amycolatopsis albidoflavus TaxID=102226 RepID=A0ABW5HYR3_9PSEU
MISDRDENDAAAGASLTAQEEAAFWRDGFAGPFRPASAPQCLPALADRLEDVVLNRRPHPVYGRYSHRDWHLVDKELESVLTQDAVVGRVASLLGPDLLLWRSKIFHKPPGGDAIGWHQEWGAFDGEEIGNSTPSLRPVDPEGKIWDLTVWIALDDVTEENGPLRFVPGSQRTRVPWKRVPMPESAFYEEPFQGLAKDEIAKRTRSGELILDIDTSAWLTGFDVDGSDRDTLVDHLTNRFRGLWAKFTEYSPDPADVVTMTMKAGDFLVFSERTMHSSPANLSGRRRTAVNCRITTADTLVYPGRLTQHYIDGSNLDIRHHESVLVSGTALESRNRWRTPR